MTESDSVDSEPMKVTPLPMGALTTGLTATAALELNPDSGGGSHPRAESIRQYDSAPFPNPMTIPTSLEIESNRSSTKQNLKRRRAPLTEDDPQYRAGRQEELIRHLPQRTGESREAVERTFGEDSSDSSAAMYRRFLSRNWLGLP